MPIQNTAKILSPSSASNTGNFIPQFMKRKHHSSFRARSDSEASASSGSESDHGEGSERTCTLHSSTKTGTKHSNNEDTYIATFDVAASTKRKGSNTAALFAVFDGHGGGFCSKYLKENFLFHLMNQNLDLEAGVEEAEMKFCKRARRNCDDSGACLIACMISQDNEYLVAGVGDCRCVLSVGFGAKRKVRALSRDHTARSELARIRRAGGYVSNGRVAGILEPARTIGDLDVKDEANSGLIATPEMKKGKIEPGALHIFVLASDGLWDVMSNKDAICLIEKHIRDRKGKPSKQIADSKNLTSFLVQEAFNKGSSDDITALVCIVW